MAMEELQISKFVVNLTQGKQCPPDTLVVQCRVPVSRCLPWPTRYKTSAQCRLPEGAWDDVEHYSCSPAEPMRVLLPEGCRKVKVKLRLGAGTLATFRPSKRDTLCTTVRPNLGRIHYRLGLKQRDEQDATPAGQSVGDDATLGGQSVGEDATPAGQSVEGDATLGGQSVGEDATPAGQSVEGDATLGGQSVEGVVSEAAPAAASATKMTAGQKRRARRRRATALKASSESEAATKLEQSCVVTEKEAAINSEARPPCAETNPPATNSDEPPPSDGTHNGTKARRKRRARPKAKKSEARLTATTEVADAQRHN